MTRTTDFAQKEGLHVIYKAQTEIHRDQWLSHVTFPSKWGSNNVNFLPGILALGKMLLFVVVTSNKWTF